MEMREFIKKNRIYIILGIAFILCLLRAFKGFCWTDESFYISTADRFYKGDALLKTEWYRTQLSSVICLPFYAAFMAITGSNTGVILFFRILYLLLSLTTAIIAYRVITKEYSDSVGTVIAILIMFYAHLNVTALSYYMMSLHFLLIALFLIYDYYTEESKLKLIIAGCVFALCVLSLPSFAVAYFIAVIAAFIIYAFSKLAIVPEEIRQYVKRADIPRVFWYTLIGIIIPALIFTIYLLMHVSIQDIITAVPNIMVDKEHDFTFGFCIRRFFFSVSDVYGGYTKISYLLIVGCFLAQKFIKKTRWANVIVIADVALFVIYAIRSYGHTGYIQSALVLFALPIFFLSDRKNHKIFWLYTVSGLSLAMTYSFSSSDFLYVLAIGHFVTAVGCVVFMYDYVIGQKQLYENGDSSKIMDIRLYKVAAICLSLIALYTCCVTVSLRLTSVYRDAPIPMLNCKITHGIAKGLYTTEEHLKYYDDVYEVLDEFCQSASTGNDANDTIMFSKILPWGYMCTDLKCGYPTTWRATAYNETQLNEYYEANQDKHPSIILVLNEEYGSYDASGDVEDDHNPNLDEMNDYWKNYIIDNKMTKEQVSCGYLYKLP